MTKKTCILLTFFLTLIFVSCNSATPTGFWKNYKTKCLVSNISDQGPFGGHRAVYWKSDKQSTFDTKDILDFATKNGWTFTDSSSFGQNLAIKWMYENKKIFPLSRIGFNDTIMSEKIYNVSNCV